MSKSTPEELFDHYQSFITAQNRDTSALLQERFPQSSSIPDLLARLDLLKSWLDSFRPLPADVLQELRQFYTVSLTYNSNAIEGNTLTLHETEMVLSHGITVGGKTLTEHLEVIGHRDAMEYMEDLAREKAAISEWEIKNLHSLILRPIDQNASQHEAGKYRSLDVRAAGTDHIYPPHFHIPDLMKDFISWLNSPAAKAMHPVEYATEAHYQLVSIHPFRDGNGRTARLLMNLCLLRAGFPISVISNDTRSAYIEAIIAAQDHGNKTPLVILIAQACQNSLIEYLRLLSTASSSRGKGSLFYQTFVAAS